MGIAAPLLAPHPLLRGPVPQARLQPQLAHLYPPIQAPQPSDRPSNPTPLRLPTPQTAVKHQDGLASPGTGARGGRLAVLCTSSRPITLDDNPDCRAHLAAKSSRSLGSTCASTPGTPWGSKAVGSSARGGPVREPQAAALGQAALTQMVMRFQGHESAQVVKVVAPEELGGPQKAETGTRARGGCWGDTHTQTQWSQPRPRGAEALALLSCRTQSSHLACHPDSSLRKASQAASVLCTKMIATVV